MALRTVSNISPLLALLGLLTLMSPSARAESLTIGALLGGTKSLVKQLETSAVALLEQGNTYAAQQQQLLAGTLEATIRQVEEAYGSSLDKTYDALSTVERNSFEGFRDLHLDVRRTLEETHTSLEGTIYTTQASVNQILDRLPLVERHHIVFGIRTRDLLLERENVKGDILVLGHLLADPELDLKKPQVFVAEEAISPSLVTATQDRITVILPEALKEKIRLGNTPCEPLKSFKTRVVAYYDDGSWLNRINPFYGGDEIELTTSSFPGNPFFEFSLRASGTAVTITPVKRNFSTKTGSVSVGCEDSASTQVSWRAPEGARQLNATARWVETKRLKRKSAQAAVSGLTATATGSIRGKDKEFFNCPGGGKGKLQLTGTYVIDRREEGPTVYEASASTRDRQVRLVLPDDAAFDQVELQLRRRGCGETLDSLLLPLVSDRNARSSQSSERGLFSVLHQQGQVIVSLARE